MRNLIPHYIQEEYQKGHFEGEFEGLTMLVDVSGFTLMTQALVTHGRTGAEVSATVINEIFDELTNAVYERGGFVSTFAGDISTAIFPFNDEIIPVKETVLQVFACVKRIQALFRGHGIQTTPFGQFIFHFRIGISGGKINWGIVGETERSYFFRGEAIDGCVASKHQAGEDEVIFDKYVTQRLKHVPGVTGRARYLRSIQVDYLSDGFCRIKKQPGGFYEGETRVEPLLEEFSLPDLPTSPELDPTVLSHFFPETVIHFPQIGEFRRVVSIFISFGGISTVNEINDWACVLLKNINTFGGYFHRLNFGGNDGCVLCGFGAPMAYENAIERAVNFIISVKEDLKSFQNLSDLRFRVGMTYGMAYAGIVGPEKRCEYTYYGAVVHLAACFMMKAGWGKIIVSKEIVQKAPKFNFVYQGDFSDKGITESVPTYTLVGRKIDGGQQRFTEAMIGRREELQRLQQFAAPIFRQSFAGLLGIYGEAGIGKSRLTYALQEALVQQKESMWFMCPADQILHKPFHPFITCFMRYFKQSPENSKEENTATFEREYDELIEALSPHPRPLSQRERGEKP
ncbi:MAG: AAA family ATPase, partial [bacterium]|nr:AAA family ATPase [bacterium]